MYIVLYNKEDKKKIITRGYKMNDYNIAYRREEAQLSREEEFELFEKIQSGSIQARNRLVSANLAFVRKVVQQFKGSSIPHEDLVSEGALGLLRAAESFDPTRGVKFISYAVWWIKAFITRAINEKGTLIRLPANQNYKIRKAIREYDHEEKLADEVQTLLNIGEGHVSLDKPLDDGSSTMSTFLADEKSISPEDNIDFEKMGMFTEKLLSKIPERESYVIKELFGIDKMVALSAQEIAYEMGISKERVRQLRDQGLNRIRLLNYDGNISDEVNDYLDNAERVRAYS